MEFEPEYIVKDTYWAFGMFAKKNGSVDYKQLKSDLEQLEYYIAAIILETADGEYFARLAQPVGYKWIFENTKDDSEDCSEYFKDFTTGSVFERFADHASEIIKRGFNTLTKIIETNPDELKKNGINIGKVKNLVSIAPSIINKTNNGLFHPMMKKF